MGRLTWTFIILAVGAGAQAVSFPIAPLESVFDLPRPDGEDVVYFRNGDILRGQVLNERIAVATQYGMLSFPIRQCAGLSLEGTGTSTEEVVLVNFNRVTGIVSDRAIRLRVGPSGTEIPIHKEKIRFVLLEKRPQELDLLKDQAKADLFVMANGDLLSGAVVEPKITIRTDYGQMPVLFAEMKELRLQNRDKDKLTAAVTKTNGDTIHGVLETEEISLRLALGLDLPSLYLDKFARIFIGQALTQAPVEFSGPPPGLEEPPSAAPAGPAAPPEPVMTLYLGKQVTLKLVRIPAGRFLMGSPAGEVGHRDEEEPLRQVTISRPFYLGVYEVTQSQYAVIMGNNPSRLKGATRPVETVSWDEATEFCTRLAQRTGKKVTLPSEAQWEYACRAGATARFCFGNEESQLVTYARFGQSGSEGTVPAGQGKSNAWGLYDMHGNVTEWCADWYAASYGGLPSADPTGPKSGQTRVVRGGCWGNSADDCRAAARKGFTPDSRTAYRGFRIVVEAN